MTTEKQLAISELPEKQQALEVFTVAKGLDPWLEKITVEAKSLVADLSTKKGRDDIGSMAYKVRQSKTALDKIGKELVDQLKEQPKLVDAERKRMRDYLDSLAEEVRKPLDEFEASEAARVAKHKANLSTLQQAPTDGFSSDQIKMLITCISSNLIDESWQEFEAEAHRVKAATIAVYESALTSRRQHEAEQAELARLREEAAERARQDEIARIQREAADKA